MNTNPLLKYLDGLSRDRAGHQDPQGDRVDRGLALRLVVSPVPPKISILSAVTVPNGGDTMWCNQYQAYERLSPTMKRMLEGLRVKFVGFRSGAA